MFNGFEQIDECIIAVYDVLGCLIWMSEGYLHMYRRRPHTASRIARPACIAFTGGNGCKRRQRCETRHRYLVPVTYQANVDCEGGSGRKSAHNRHRIFDGFHHFISSSVFVEELCLTLQHSGNGLDRFAALELDGEWVFGQYDACLFFISLQGRLEELAKSS
jgi:hypothetical protein